MKTTLGKILSFDPCNQNGPPQKGGWKKLLQTIEKAGLKYDPNIEVTPKQILESNGIKDAVWGLRAFEYKDYCLFLADIAESLYPIYKKYNPHDWKVWNCIQSIHYYYHGFITKEQLLDTVAAAAAAYFAARATYATIDAIYVIIDAARAVDTAYAAVDTAYATIAAAADIKWKKIEEIFIQHFCE